MIRLVALDVDGTLTDGGIYMDGNGGEFKRFDVRDGAGLVALRRAGITVALISGRYSAATQRRADDLKIERVCNGVGDKLPALIGLAEEIGASRDETVFVGDDVQDIECIKWAGIGIAVADAHKSVIAEADWVTSSCGGHGALREVADRILLGEAIDRT